MLQGRWLQPGDTTAITVSEAIWSDYPGLKPGDKLKLKINGQEDFWTVVGIFRFISRDEIIAYATYDYVSGLLNMTRSILLLSCGYRSTLPGLSKADGCHHRQRPA